MDTKNLKFTFAFLTALCAFSSGKLLAQTLEVSRSSLNESSNAASSNPTINTDGRYIAFQSDASTLVSNDTNGVSDIFLLFQDFITENGANTHDTRVTTRVSVATDGTQANGASFSPSIARDAERFIAFASSASNLVADDTNGKDDIFIRDTSGGQTYRISVQHDIFGTVTGEANGHSSTPSISSDGCYVVFASEASNLNALDDTGSLSTDTNGKKDIFLYYNPLGLNGCNSGTPYLELISIGPNNTQPDGDSYAPIFGTVRFISFTSSATNLIASDLNSFPDIFVRDRALTISGQNVSRLTVLASKASDGTQANGESFTSSLLGDAGIFFDSNATNLVSGDTNGKRDIFRFAISGARDTGVTTRVSVNEAGVEGNGNSFSPSVAGGDNYVAFASDATNLIDRSDCNAATDIFIWDYLLNHIRRVNLSTSGYQSGSGLSSSAPTLAYGSLLVAYQSDGVFSTQDDNALQDIYISVASEDPNAAINPLSKNEPLDEKPDVCVTNKKANVFMEYFSSISSSDVSNKAKINAAKGCKGQGICYQVTANPVKANGRADKKRDIKKLTGKKNDLSLSGLKPGNYNVSFKVVGKSGSSTISSKVSPKALITVSR